MSRSKDASCSVLCERARGFAMITKIGGCGRVVRWSDFSVISLPKVSNALIFLPFVKTGRQL